MRLFSRKKSKSSMGSLKRTSKRLLIVSGCMLSLLMVAPSMNVEAIDNVLGIETAYAAETYSENWKENQGVWQYYLNDGSLAKDAWIQDHGEWYLLDSSGNMRVGLFKSNGGKYYLLDTVRGTGTYGKLLKNNMVYGGITLKCDTSSAYEGALSQETINALRGIGLDFDSAPSVENTQHVSNGKVETNPGGGATENNIPGRETDGGYDLGGGTGGYTVPEKEIYVP